MLSWMLLTSLLRLLRRAVNVICWLSTISFTSGELARGELASQLTMSGGSVISCSSLISACSLASIAVRRMRRRNSRCNSARAAVSSSSSKSLPGFHLVAFAHVDLADHSALEMLDDLVLSGNDEHARGDHGAGDRRHVAPDAEAHQRHRHDQRTGNGWQLGRSRQRIVPGAFCFRGAVRNFPVGHRVTSLLSNRADALDQFNEGGSPGPVGMLFGLRPVIIGMISSRLPKACTEP